MDRIKGSHLIVVGMSLLLLVLNPVWKADALEKITERPTASASQSKAFAEHIECPGIIRFQRQFDLRLFPGEKVIKYFVKNGAIVKEGALLALLTNDSLIERITRLRGQVLEIDKDENHSKLIDIKIKEALKEVHRIEKKIAEERKIIEKVPNYPIEEKINIWKEEIETKLSKIRILKHELDILKQYAQKRSLLTRQMQKQIITLQEQSLDLEIKAPFSGTVLKIPAFPRETLPGDIVLSLYDTNSLEVEVKAWQQHLPYIQPGFKAEIFYNDNHELCVGGTVRSIGIESIESKNEGFPYFPVLIDLDKPDVRLRSGMAVTVKILKDVSKKEE